MICRALLDGCLRGPDICEGAAQTLLRGDPRETAFDLIEPRCPWDGTTAAFGLARDLLCRAKLYGVLA